MAVGGEGVKSLAEAQRKLITFLAKGAAAKNKFKGKGATRDPAVGSGCLVLVDTTGNTQRG